MCECVCVCVCVLNPLTLLPRIWLMAALSFSVHSAMTFALISFMYSMKAFRGFLMTGFLGSFSLLASPWGFLRDHRRYRQRRYRQRGNRQSRYNQRRGERRRGERRRAEERRERWKAFLWETEEISSEKRRKAKL